jgi:hypothetical protein
MKMEREACRMEALLEEWEWQEGLQGVMFIMGVSTRKWHGLRRMNSARKR